MAVLCGFWQGPLPSHRLRTQTSRPPSPGLARVVSLVSAGGTRSVLNAGHLCFAVTRGPETHSGPLCGNRGPSEAQPLHLQLDRRTRCFRPCQGGLLSPALARHSGRGGRGAPAALAPPPACARHGGSGIGPSQQPRTQFPGKIATDVLGPFLTLPPDTVHRELRDREAPTLRAVPAPGEASSAPFALKETAASTPCSSP